MATPRVGDLLRIAVLPAFAKQIGVQQRLVGRVTAVNGRSIQVTGRGELMQGGVDGACWMCNRPLSSPASLQVGVGPDCAASLNLGWLGTVRNRPLTDQELLQAKRDLTVDKILPIRAIAWGPVDGPPPVLEIDKPSPEGNDRGLEAMPPIGTAPTDLVPLDVTLPDPYHFFPYQEIGVRTWMTVGNLLLADDMGLGKSLQVIGGILQARYMARSDPRYKGMKRIPSVIVCPKSLRGNWAAELRRFAPELHVQVLEGRDSKLLKNQDIYITHPENLATRKIDDRPVLSKAGAALAKLKMLALVGDESHKYKTGSAIRTLAMAELAQAAQYRALLSGTAILARPRELLPQLQILGKLEEHFGSTQAFRIRFCNLTLRRLGRRRVWDDSGRSNLSELNLRLAPIMLRRKKEDVLKDLPEKTYARIVVELSNQEQYQRFEDAIADAEPGQRAAMTAQLRRLLAEGKIEPAIDWIQSFLDSTEDEKLVVFAYHRNVQQALVEAFPDSARIFSDVDMKRLKLDVEEEKRRFAEDPGCRTIVCSLLAAGFGHTLTTASNLLLVELDYTPGNMTQAADRIHRPGQQWPCTIWTLVAEDSVDDRLTEILVEKQQVTSMVLDGEERVLTEQTVTQTAIRDILKRVRERKKRAA